MNFKRTLYLIGTDIQKYASVNSIQNPGLFKKLSIFFMPCILCVANHRMAFYFYKKKINFLARFFWSLNIFLFSADIVIYSEIGESFYLPHPVGVALMAKIGNNCTLFAQTGIAGRKAKDIGAGVGASILGDNVVVGAFSKIVGPVQIGNNATIAPGSIVYKNVPDHVTVYGIPAKIISQKPNLGEQDV